MSMSFDKKLAELDAYLQMLIVENEAIERKLDALISSSTSSLQSIAAHDREREGIQNIKSHLEKLISSIKHSIVLLQIAKVSSNGTTSSCDFHHSSRARFNSPPTRPSRSSKLAKDNHNSSADCGSSNYSSSDSYNSQHRVSTPSLKSRENQASSFESQPVEVTPKISKSRQQLQRSRLAAPDDTCSSAQQATAAVNAPSSSPGGSSNGVVSDHLHHQHSSRHMNALVNLSGTSVSGRDDADKHDGKAAIETGRQLNVERADREREASLLDEDDEDAFFDAADEQQQQQQQHPKPSGRLDVGGHTLLVNAPQSIDKVAGEQDTHDDNLNKRNATSDSFRIHPANSPKGATMAPHASSSTNETNNNNDNTIEDGSIDWDAMYEDEEEEELDSLEGQGSVIKHLLSQIRIGMDLTKVVLPTFILERRSLLEMYADFFAHPDLFSAIPDCATPEQRMVQLVKWYLSAFHAGRRSSVAKKPYNPILGEIFRCDWQIPQAATTKSARTTTHPQEKANSSVGPQQQQVMFVAEQVSHHPPVSAFYAENKEKNISCCAHIYTKSKYLGLSVGVHNLGQGVISVPAHGETYVCTFPSAYGRSILTVPWVELGGSVSISCEQTGFKANIEFVTKPFYGGKKHRVVGEILRPNNEPFLAIDGEWNGVMYSKSPPGSSRKEVFVDTASLPVIKKHVKPVSGQESFESRNVWKEVTRALKLRDVSSATAAKTYIEQRQRDLLKERQEKGAKWRTRFFEHAEGDSWQYSPARSPDQ